MRVYDLFCGLVKEAAPRWEREIRQGNVSLETAKRIPKAEHLHPGSEMHAANPSLRAAFAAGDPHADDPGFKADPGHEAPRMGGAKRLPWKHVALAGAGLGLAGAGAYAAFQHKNRQQ